MTADPSFDEHLLFMATWVVIFWSLAHYLGELNAGSKLTTHPVQRRLLIFVPVAALGFLMIILRFFAAKEVRESKYYSLLFLFLGAAWVLLFPRFFPRLGLSIRHDVSERRNASAAIAASGGVMAISLAYTGGNIGEGANIWTTVFSCFLATAGLFACWFLLEVVSRISLAITEERDLASGWRLAGYLVAVGLIIGRAVAGNWQSVEATLKDFCRCGWLALVLTAVAIAVERGAQPSLKRHVPPTLTFGLVPACLYLAIAIVVLFSLGKW